MKGKMLEHLNNLFAKIFLIIFIGTSSLAYSEEKKVEFLRKLNLKKKVFLFVHRLLQKFQMRILKLLKFQFLIMVGLIKKEKRFQHLMV